MGLNFDICLAYLDDIIVYSCDLQSHMERLEKLFQQLREANLKLKPSKFSILQKRVAFLGYVVSETGIGTDPSQSQIPAFANIIADLYLTFRPSLHRYMPSRKGVCRFIGLPSVKTLLSN